MEQEDDKMQNQYFLQICLLLAWFSHFEGFTEWWMLPVCVYVRAFALTQYHWTPDNNIKSCSNGTQTVSMSDPWALLIHSLIDNLCSRRCMGPFISVCVCAPLKQQYASCNNVVTCPVGIVCCWVMICVRVCVCVCVCLCQMHQTCWQVISWAKASHWGIITRSHTHTNTEGGQLLSNLNSLAGHCDCIASVC